MYALYINHLEADYGNFVTAEKRSRRSFRNSSGAVKVVCGERSGRDEVLNADATCPL